MVNKMDDDMHLSTALRFPGGCQLCAGQSLGTERMARRIVRYARWLRRSVALRTRVRWLLSAIRGERGDSRAMCGIAGSAPAERSAAVELAAGDHVRVRSPEEIAATLDDRGRCHGCAFLRPMLQYCGREFSVARVVTQFFDEARGRMLTCRNIVLLAGVFCDGSGHPATRGCERMCFFFWRTEWLERVVPSDVRRPDPPPPQAVPHIASV